MGITAEQLTSLRWRIQERNQHFLEASRNLAQFNTSTYSHEARLEERLQQNFEFARIALVVVQHELKDLLASPDASPLVTHHADSEATTEVIVRANDALLSFLAQHPNYLHSLHSRTFEKLIARIFIDMGCSVELMRATHDGGKDIIVRTSGPTGHSISYVQCKRNSPFRPIGIEVVRQLFGIQMADHANKSMIVTTSHFTTEAVDFARNVEFLISLRDYFDVVSWLSPYRSVA